MINTELEAEAIKAFTELFGDEAATIVKSFAYQHGCSFRMATKYLIATAKWLYDKDGEKNTSRILYEERDRSINKSH